MLYKRRLKPQRRLRSRPSPTEEQPAKAGFVTVAANLFALLVIVPFVLTACSSEAQLLQEGNQSFTNGAYDEAAQAYTEAQQVAPELAEPVYNQANTQYRQEGLAGAEQLLQEALQTADSTLAQSAYYNLGNVHFNNQNWEAAIEAYQEALRLNPADEDARHNLELAMQQLQQQQQQEEEQQPEEEPPEEEEEEKAGEQGSEGAGEQEEDEEQDSGDEEQDENETAGQSVAEQHPEEPEGSEEQQNDPNAEQQTAENQDQQSDVPVQAQQLTPEQAKQLLEAVAQDAETLQEHLQQIYQAPGRPGGNDW